MMNKKELITKIEQPEYDFLREDEHLGKNIILLTVGGSHAYGTNTETSDLDIRGVCTKMPREILVGKKMEQVINESTDTTIYGFEKFVNLVSDCNPNTIELLGNVPEHYIYLSPAGKQLLDNRKIFLSKKCKYTFGGYANQQLRRLQNALARDNYPGEEKRHHIINSMKNTVNSLFEEYNDSIEIYQKNEEINITLKQDLEMPVKQMNSFMSQMTNIVRDYEKLNHRNSKKDLAHLNKHAMHLVRLYFTGIDILEKEEIITYRKPEHFLLMQIRKGFFVNPDGTYHPSFFELVNDLDKRFKYAAENTSLPDKPNYKDIEEFIYEVNRSCLLQN